MWSSKPSLFWVAAVLRVSIQQKGRPRLRRAVRRGHDQRHRGRRRARVRHGRVDLYVQPFIQYTRFGDLHASAALGGGTAETDSEFGGGAALGSDARFGTSKWMFTSAIRYMPLKVGDPSLK